MVVAPPVAGNARVPFTVTLVVAPVPTCDSAEFWMLVAVENKGMVLTAPPVVVTSYEPGGVDAAAVVPAGFTAGLAGALATGAASRKAEGGNPPMVSASAALSA